MEWDQRAFAWLYRAVRRVSGRGGQADEVESPLHSLTARFETLSNLLTGARWEVVAGSGMGGVAPGRLVLPQDLAWLRDPDDQASFYLYRVVIGLTASGLGFVAGRDWSSRRRALAMLIGVPSIQDAIVEQYPGAESLVTRCTASVAEQFPFDEQTAEARCFSMACRTLLGDSDPHPSEPCGGVRRFRKRARQAVEAPRWWRLPVAMGPSHPSPEGLECGPRATRRSTQHATERNRAQDAPAA